MRFTLRGLAGLFGLFSGFGVLAIVSVQPSADAASAQRPQTTTAFVVEVNGEKIGQFKEAGGGNARGTVVIDPASRNANIVNKHIGPIKYGDITLLSHGELSKRLATWIATGLAGTVTRKDGSLTAVDGGGSMQSRLTWTQGALAEVQFPAFSVANRESAAVRVVVRPQSTRREAASGSAKAPAGKPSAKPWLASNFRLRIDGLESATSAASRIEPLSVRFQGAQSATGGDQARALSKSGKVDVANLVFYVRAGNAKPLYDWHEDFVVKGNGGDAQERTGTVELLDAGQRDVLATIGLNGLGIIDVGPDTETDDQDVRVEMYVESVTFSVK